MEKFQDLLDGLNKFEETGNKKHIPIDVEQYLRHVAYTANIIFPWQKVKHLYRAKLLKVIGQYYEILGVEVSDSPNVPPFSFCAIRDNILEHFDRLTQPPFTIQRLSELLIDPTEQYKRTDKYLRGLEKNIFVVSPVEPPKENSISELMDDVTQNLKSDVVTKSILGAMSPTSSEKHLKRKNSESESKEEHVNGDSITNGILEDGESTQKEEGAAPSPKRRKIDSEDSPVSSPESELKDSEPPVEKETPETTPETSTGTKESDATECEPSKTTDENVEKVSEDEVVESTRSPESALEETAPTKPESENIPQTDSEALAVEEPKISESSETSEPADTPTEADSTSQSSEESTEKPSSTDDASAMSSSSKEESSSTDSDPEAEDNVASNSSDPKAPSSPL